MALGHLTLVHHSATCHHAARSSTMRALCTNRDGPSLCTVNPGGRHSTKGGQLITALMGAACMHMPAARVIIPAQAWLWCKLLIPPRSFCAKRRHTLMPLTTMHSCLPPLCSGQAVSAPLPAAAMLRNTAAAVRNELLQPDPAQLGLHPRSGALTGIPIAPIA